MDKIEKENYETVHMRVFDGCVLPNNLFLISTLHSIAILDESFNIIKEIEEIDGNGIDCHGLAFNIKKNCIYASIYLFDCLYMLDSDLNNIKSFGSQESNNNLNSPSGICFKDPYLYVCDRGNKRIQILNSDLEFIDTITLDFKPLTIKISDSLMGISTSDTLIQFFDLNKKELKKQYDNLDGRLSEIDSLFYLVTFSPSKMVYCFDEDGNLKIEINIDRFSKFLCNYWDGNILKYNNNLIMTSYNRGRIMKFI